ALSPPIVVSALNTSSLGGSITTGPVTLVAGTSIQMSLALDVINATLPNTWQNAQNNPVNLKVSTDALVDCVISPTSPSAQINVSQDLFATLPLNALFDVSNPYESGGSKELTIAAQVCTLAACAVMTGGLAGAELLGGLAVAPEVFYATYGT